MGPSYSGKTRIRVSPQSKRMQKFIRLVSTI